MYSWRLVYDRLAPGFEASPIVSHTAVPVAVTTEVLLPSEHRSISQNHPPRQRSSCAGNCASGCGSPVAEVTRSSVPSRCTATGQALSPQATSQRHPWEMRCGEDAELTGTKRHGICCRGRLAAPLGLRRCHPMKAAARR